MPDTLSRPAIRSSPSSGTKCRASTTWARPACTAYPTMPTATSSCMNHHVEKLIAAGADEIMFMTNMGGIPQDAMMETIRNIGEHVIPHFRNREEQLQAAE
ncbi:hypothetical protein AB5I41_14255 [Sphingomonas sp. MMS24-JH45]